ncbi:hypothetical protein C3F09_04115 [candidate division GN15 bacterium]|uniref:T9SS type A sorting domain-containing protein n=1 Tax=candidate division GN15 bacterium TaxID=2072418 RepID=A0A855X4X8_9BACT|nr:MAG: hypothetical protein C3F09_04115 [candidate division GN15 bacterium]
MPPATGLSRRVGRLNCVLPDLRGLDRHRRNDPGGCDHINPRTLFVGGNDMKRLVTLVSVASFLFVASVCGDTLTVLHLNDTHAHLLPYGPKDAEGVGMFGGMARVATLIGMNKMSEPNVLLLHAGDISVGDFMFQKYLSIPELEIMKQLGYDAFTLGNHEFDLYPSTLKYELSTAGFPGSGFPVLCANLDYSADPEMGVFIKPYVIKEFGGTKVGIFGLTTDFANSGSNPQPDVILPPLSVAQAWIDTLRVGHGCNVVILLSHLGTPTDQAVAASTAGLDVIVGGHTHTQLDQPITIGNTLIVQAGEFGHYVGKLHLFVDGGVITGHDFQLMTVDNNVPAEPTTAGMLAMLAAGVEADTLFGPVFSHPVAQAAIDLDKDFGQGLVMDNPMGNMIADAFRQATATDIVFQPQGFINQQIWAGPQVGDDIFQTVPYGFDQTTRLGFKLATFETDGMSIIAGLEFSVYNLPYLEDFFMQVSNFTYAYNSSAAPGSRVDYGSITIGGSPLNPFGTYTVTVPDGVVPFLTQIPGFSVNNLTITDQFMYTVVRDFMAAHSPVAYYRQGKVLDLAAITDPMAGVEALVQMVSMDQLNGSITKAKVAEILTRDFGIVAKHIEGGRDVAAGAKLHGTAQYVKAQMRLGLIGDMAGQTLLYVMNRVAGSLAPANHMAQEPSPSSESALIPAVFELAQNFPNPFNPSTAINFTLPSAMPVSLEIYNVLGQRVKTLVDATMAAGSHVAQWDGTDQYGGAVSTGVYFYRLVAGDQTATKKMMLLK